MCTNCTIVEAQKHNQDAKWKSSARRKHGIFSSSSSNGRNTKLEAKSRKKRNNDYIKELKKWTKCNNSKEVGHWAVKYLNKDKVMGGKKRIRQKANATKNIKNIQTRTLFVKSLIGITITRKCT